MSVNLPFYQIDAFARRPFEGNQACVMPLKGGFLADDVLQAIAAENNVAETAFIVERGEGVWDLRWFTPAVEVPLCGHATLAAAHVLFAHNGFTGDTVAFDTRQSGRLSVRRAGDGYEMDFPAPEVFEVEPDSAIIEALGARPLKAWGGPFYAALFDSSETVIGLQPDLRALKGLGVGAGRGDWGRGNFGCMAAGGPGGADVTSRFFAPGSGIDEDPATGSWHCMLAAIMAPRLGVSRLACWQAFPGRGARVGAELTGERVKLSGEAVTVIEGQFRL